MPGEEKRGGKGRDVLIVQEGIVQRPPFGLMTIKYLLTLIERCMLIRRTSSVKQYANCHTQCQIQWFQEFVITLLFPGTEVSALNDYFLLLMLSTYMRKHRGFTGQSHADVIHLTCVVKSAQEFHPSSSSTSARFSTLPLKQWVLTFLSISFGKILLYGLYFCFTVSNCDNFTLSVCKL